MSASGRSTPLLVAHRAGNSLAALQAAEAARVDLVELDVWLARGQLEVRHEKTLGPVPVLWDRWSLAPAWLPRLLLDDIVRASAPTTEFMLDLKGTARALSVHVLRRMEQLAPGRPYTVASQSWTLLEPFEGIPHVRVVHSVGNERMLLALPRRLRGRASDVGIHHEMLSPERVTMLHDLASTVFTWTVNTRARFEDVTRWGVDGVISDRYALLLGSGAPPLSPSTAS